MVGEEMIQLLSSAMQRKDDVEESHSLDRMAQHKEKKQYTQVQTREI